MAFVINYQFSITNLKFSNLFQYATLYYKNENQKQMTSLSLLFSLIFLSFLQPYAHFQASFKECILDSHTVVAYAKFINMPMFVDIQDNGISSVIRQTGQHNTALIQLFLKYIFQGESIIHIGSHVGLQTLAMSKYIKNRGYRNVKIHAIEPNQLYYIMLIKSLYLNNLNEIVRVYKAAAYKQQAQGQIAVKNVDTSSAQIMINTKTQRKADYKYNARCISINKAFQGLIQNKISIGLVYISANTMEIEVLMGMSRILLENRDIVVVVMDWQFGKNNHKNVDGIIQILERFHENKYKLFQIRTQEKKPSYQQIDNFISILQIKQGKFILIPKSKKTPLQLIQ